MNRVIFTILAIVFGAVNVSSQINFNAFISDDAETTTFINLSQHNSSDPYMLFYWKLGDGRERFAGNELEHFYDSPGIYHVTLIGITRNGLRDTLSKTFTIPLGLEFLTEEGEAKKKELAQDFSNLKDASVATTKKKDQNL